MKVLAVLLVLVAIAKVQSELLKHTPEEKQHWESFKSKYLKEYTVEQEVERFVIFLINLRQIVEHNKQGKTFSLKINKFGDMSNEEYRKFLKNSSNKKSKFHRATISGGEKLPVNGDVNAVEVDWRTKGVVTPVKDQGQCGSCYSFSAIGAIEGQYALKYKKLLSFSEKLFVDCSDGQGNEGCDGGLVEYCYDYAIKKGVVLESDYLYEDIQGECLYDETQVVTKVASYYNLPVGSEQDLVKQLAKTGPVAVAIDAGNFSFQFYDQGIYDEEHCGHYAFQLDHAVLAVGYGTDDVNDKDYYIVKNSWGPDWGIDGYIYMTRNEKNQCGIATDAVVPVMV